MRTYGTLGIILLAAVSLAGCGGGTTSGSGNTINVGLKRTIAVTNVGATTNFSFDIGGVDNVKGRYYLTDRNNKSVDVFDINSNSFIKDIPGFAGCNTGPSCAGANNDKSGPDGLVIIPGTTLIFVGDVNSVKIIDTTTDAIVNTINIGGSSGLRADEGCYDPDHNLFMINSPAENPPFSTFIDVGTQKIIAQLLFTDPGTGAGGPPSAGLEGCVYDHASASFFVNNDGSTANPHGETDVIPASFVLAGTPSNPVVLTLPVPTPANRFAIYPLGNCDPTGMDLGPGNDLGIMCRQGTTGALLTFQILDRTTGAALAVLNAGGGDQIAYDSASNRWFLSSSRFTASGLAAAAGTCSAATPCTPRLIVVDGTSRTILAKVGTGNNAHSLAVDPVGHQVYMPYSSSAAPAGCTGCDAYPNGVGNVPAGEGGVAVYTSQ